MGRTTVTPSRCAPPTSSPTPWTIPSSRGPCSAWWPADLPGRRLGSEQSNTSVTFGTRLILKHFRRLAEGRNPEEEMTRFLTERARFPHTPRLAGHIEYRRPDGVMT